MKTIHIELVWRSVQTVEVPEDYVFTGTLDEEWTYQIDLNIAELVDWDIVE